MAYAEFEGGRRTHGQADEVRLGNSQAVQQGCCVIGGPRLRESIGPFRHLGWRPAPRRIGYAAVAAGKEAQLRLPTQMGAAELVHKQNRVTRACLLVGAAELIVGPDPWHAFAPPVGFSCRRR